MSRSKRLALRAATACLVIVFLVFLFGSRLGKRLERRAERTVRGQKARFAQTLVVDRFLRGSLHAHSTQSDGKASFQQMTAWYRDHGYQFAAMTEHNRRIDPDAVRSLQGDGFVLIPGEEVTNSSRGKPVHVNALCANATIGGGQDFPRTAEALAVTFQRIRSQGGVPLLNHPNYRYALDEHAILEGAQGAYLFEVWSGHPEVHSEGGAGHPSAEVLWDAVLEEGVAAAPAAVDDAHQLNPEDGDEATPGHGWVWTFGDEIARPAICAALAAGRLYASSGPVLSRIEVGPTSLTIGTASPSAKVTFVGEGGEELATVPATGSPAKATYDLRGDETVVRARIADEGPGHAWTPAFFVVAR